MAWPENSLKFLRTFLVQDSGDYPTMETAYTWLGDCTHRVALTLRTFCTMLLKRIIHPVITPSYIKFSSELYLKSILNGLGGWI